MNLFYFLFSLSYKIGEQLVYHVYYGIIGAGIAYIETGEIKEIRGRPAYHFIAKGKTNKFYSLIFRVNDRIESYVDTEKFYTLRYEKHIREGTYKKDAFSDFYPESLKVIYSDGETAELVDGALDVVGIFFLVRKWEFDVGDTLILPIHVDKKNYTLKISVEKRDTIKCGIGKKPSFLLKLLVKESGEYKGKTGLESIFGSRGGLNIWLSDDEKKIPLFVSTRVFFGSIRAILQEIRNE